MRFRRWAREIALQALYQCDAMSDWSESCQKLFFLHFYPQFEEQDDATQSFCEQLVVASISSMTEIDRLINEASINWKTERMVMIDRNIIRLSVAQLLNFNDIPVKVVIDEALEITKRFSSPDATTFVNGVLDKVSRILKRQIDEKTAKNVTRPPPQKLVGNQ